MVVMPRVDGPAIDPEVLAAFRGLEASDGTALTDRILKLFLTHAPRQLSELEQQSQQRSDHQALAEAAHALKSVCSSIGARQAALACHRLEEAAMEGRLSALSDMVAAIVQEITRAVDEARHLRAGG